ncbi:MAG: glutamate synthase subunit beta [Acidobacteria bacterium]|nr:glutamate synthase subunit beta [Acidobacteriota bacterium]
MGKATGFLEYERTTAPRRPVAERVRDFFPVYQSVPEEELRIQGARCMDCGVPFCHWGCPLGNLIPDWNDMVYRGRWRDSIRALHSTNNFPEFTGTVCPAPCEASCVLGINEPAVSIKTIENAIVERAFHEGWIRPEPPEIRSGRRVAVIGSGPAGLAAAQQLNRAGHAVVVFEKADRIGGLLRYGIPDFKLEKGIIDRRLEQLREEGIRFETGAHVGVDVPLQGLRRKFDALLLAGGAERPRDLTVPGRELGGIHFAMDFLVRQNRRSAGARIDPGDDIQATGKRVVILGGGDTGADCLGTCHRQRALSVHQIEILPEPPAERSPETPWPLWPLMLRTESSHEEGGVRVWGAATTRFSGDSRGKVTHLHAVRVGAPPRFEPVAGSDFTLEADLVLLALGFTGAAPNPMFEETGIGLDGRGNVAANEACMTAVPGIFAAGDMQYGQSLVVRAIAEGRRTAHAVDRYLRQLSGGR